MPSEGRLKASVYFLRLASESNHKSGLQICKLGLEAIACRLKLAHLSLASMLARTSALGMPKVCLFSCLAILFIPLFYFFQPFLQRHHAKENVGVGVWTTRGVPALVLIQVLDDPPKMVARGLIHNSFPFIAASPGRLASGKRHGGGCISYRGMRYL
jgi:hypothetical protein